MAQAHAQSSPAGVRAGWLRRRFEADVRCMAAAVEAARGRRTEARALRRLYGDTMVGRETGARI